MIMIYILLPSHVGIAHGEAALSYSLCFVHWPYCCCAGGRLSAGMNGSVVMNRLIDLRCVGESQLIYLWSSVISLQLLLRLVLFFCPKFPSYYALNLPVSWTYFIVYFIAFGSPSSLSILTLPVPRFLRSSFLISFLWLLYLLHSIRKCSTVSFP